jgi:hypothetical protein
MRVSSINVAQPRNLSYERKIKHAELPQAEMSQIAFKGLKGGLFSMLGTAIGAGIGIALTGGAGVIVPFILGGAGAIAGGEYGNKDEPKNDDYGYSYDGPSGFDYIG